MAHVFNLRSFITEQERRLESKVIAAARGQLHSAIRPRTGKKNFTGLGPQSYQAALGHKFPPKTKARRTWPMRYEMIPHESTHARAEASQNA